MAPKKSSHIRDNPPYSSSSQDDEEEEEMEEEEEEEEEEDLGLLQVADSEEKENGFTHRTSPKTKLSRRSKSQHGDESSEEEEDSEENESGFARRTSPRAKLSQRSKSRHGDESSEEEEGGDTDDGNTRNTPAASAVNKNSRLVEEPTKRNTKRALTDAKGGKDLSKKTRVAKDQHTEEDKEGTANKGGRVFSPADDVALLGGMIDYMKEKRVDPHADMGALLEFVKGYFSFEVTRNQLYEKVRRLKRKFFANLGKGEKFVPAKPLDQECFELSNKIWGSSNEVTIAVAGYSGGGSNIRVVGNGVDHTETVKIVDGVSVTKNSAKGMSSEEKRKEKSEKKKKESHKNNDSKKKKKKKKKKKMDAGPKIVQEEAEPMTNHDVMTDKEDDGKDDKDVMIDKEDVGKDDKCVRKEMEGVWNNDENTVKDGERHIQLKYPNLVASLSMDMPDSQRKLMMEGISLVGDEKARALDDRWRELQVEEIEFHCRKLQLMAQHSRLLMDAWKKKRYDVRSKIY